MRTQIINDLMTNIFFNLIETEDRIAADERFEGLSSNDALEIYKELADHRIQTHIYAEHIGIGISSRRVSPLLNLPKLRKEDIVIYHMTTESGMYEYIRRIKKEYGCEIIFRYHSITPAQYFQPFSKDMADQCRRGLN